MVYLNQDNNNRAGWILRMVLSGVGIRVEIYAYAWKHEKLNNYNQGFVKVFKISAAEEYVPSMIC